MFYGITTKATDFTKENMRPWPVRIIETLLFFIPKGNPDAEPLYPKVKEWALELNDEGWPQREVGVDQTGKALFALPNKRNTGFWTDMAYMQFNRSELRVISSQDFMRLWCEANATSA